MTRTRTKTRSLASIGLACISITTTRGGIYANLPITFRLRAVYMICHRRFLFPLPNTRDELLQSRKCELSF